MSRRWGLVDCPTCEGDGYHGEPEYGAATNCRRCNGRGLLTTDQLDDDELAELDELESATEEEDCDE